MSPAPETAEHELLPRGRSASERAYEYVKARLLDGRFAGGTLLSENELASRLGVSRTPVRQALVQLEAEELVELYPKRGALVVPISASEEDDVLEARLLIEQYCARRAASAGPGVVERLREALADQEGADASGFAWADRAFHAVIVEAAGNHILDRTYDALRDRHQPSRNARFGADPPDNHAAIERGDGEAAATLMGRHLQGAHDLARH
jgi:DNA-binding GntR family transcriptional regulator